MTQLKASDSTDLQARVFGDQWKRRVEEIARSRSDPEVLDKLVKELRKRARGEKHYVSHLNFSLHNESGRGAVSKRLGDPVDEDLLNSLTKKVTGAGKFSDCVAVGDEDRNYFASGVLIAPTVVLTAGHSATNGFRHWVWVGNEVGEASGRAYEVSRPGPAIHPRYMGPPYYRNDLAILYLKEEVPGTRSLGIATEEEIDEATWVVAVGYGTISSDASLGMGVRRFVHLPKLNDEVVVDRWKRPVAYDRQTEFIAGMPLWVKNPKDTCAGDSGGPVYLKTKGGWSLAGITSRNAGRDKRPCGGGSIYVRLDTQKDWLEQALVEKQRTVA